MFKKTRNRWRLLRCYYQLRLNRTDITEYRRFIFNECEGLFRPLQVEAELSRLLEIVGELRPRRLLEIGTAAGGTLFLFARIAHPDASLISLDLPYGEYGGGYSPIRIPLYKRFARLNQRVALIRDDSHKRSSYEKVRTFLNGEHLDFLFIDGDHTYDGVRSDFALYSPLVREGGIIAFHDVARHPAGDACDVDKLWDEIKGKYKHEEIIENADQGWAGIGVLYV